MHEAAIAKSILDLVERKVSATPVQSAVSKVRVRIGEFRNLDPESLLFAFDALKETYKCCSNCDLSFEMVPLKVRCSLEGHEYAPNPSKGFKCDRCSGGIGLVLSGQELDLIGYTLVSTGEEVTCMK